jgi:hypothetical protein
VYYVLADADTGQLRKLLTKEDATEVAKENINRSAQIAHVDYLKSADGHHQYREGALPGLGCLI